MLAKKKKKKRKINMKFVDTQWNKITWTFILQTCSVESPSSTNKMYNQLIKLHIL